MSVSIEVKQATDEAGRSAPVIVKPNVVFPVTRMLGYYASLVAVRLPVSANQVTFISMIDGLTGCSFFLKGELIWNVYGALLIVLSYVLDYCDGVIARMKGQSSPFGASFDDFVDWIIDTSFFAALGYGIWIADGEVWWFYLGLIAAVGSTIDYAIDLVRANRYTQARKAAEREAAAAEASDADQGEAVADEAKTLKDKLFYFFHTASRAEFCFIILVLAAFDVVWVLLPFGAIGAQAFWLGDLFRKRD